MGTDNIVAKDNRKYEIKVDDKYIIQGIETQTIYLQTPHGDVMLDAPTTPGKAVMALRSAIGILEGLYPNETPYPKTIHRT